MMRNSGKLLAITTLALLLISTAPAAFGSTLTVDLNPSTKVAKVVTVSTTKIVLTYPVNSTLSGYLKGVNSTTSFSGTFQQGASGVDELQGSFGDEDSHVSVSNVSVSIHYDAKGNSTALVVNKETDITAWVTGVFSVVNGTVTADLKWRSFVVPGALTFNLEDHPVDVNLVGSAMETSLATHTFAIQYMLSAFGGEELWNRPTLNYSALSTPLTTWTKNYDSSTNTTTFSKTVSGTSTFSASVDYNGQKYTLSAISDPSANVMVNGYAIASGDSIALQQAPASSSSLLLLVAAAAAIVVVGGAAYLALRSRAKPKALAIPAVQ